MRYVDADLLGALAWTCLVAGERERAVELLDDTWRVARSPNTTILLIAAERRARGCEDHDLSAAGRSDLARRFALRDVIDREQRTRTMLDDEPDRHGLTNTL